MTIRCEPKFAPVLLLLALLAGCEAASAASIAAHVTREAVAGIDLVAYPTAIKDVVTIVGSLPAGDAHATGNFAVATMTALMLDKGTISRDKFAIAKTLEEVGATVQFGADAQMLRFEAKCLKADLPLVLGVLAEELRAPAFGPGEFAKAKLTMQGVLRQQRDNTNFRAAEAFSLASFPVGHPNRIASLDEGQTAVEHVALEDVRTFYRQHYGPAHMTVVVVGDVDVAALRREMRKGFAGWKGGVPVVDSIAVPARSAPIDQSVPMPGKTSVSVVIGQTTGLKFRDPDSLPLRIGTAVLGSGFTGRLMSTVRDKEGLTYGINASIADDTVDDGDWKVTATFAPALLEKGMASSRGEIHKWWTDGITDQELAARKTNMIGQFHVGLATTDGLALAILHTIQRGLSLTWLDDYPERINTVTRAQVNAAIRRYLDPERLVTVTAGTLEPKAP